MDVMGDLCRSGRHCRDQLVRPASSSQGSGHVRGRSPSAAPSRASARSGMSGLLGRKPLPQLSPSPEPAAETRTTPDSKTKIPEGTRHSPSVGSPAPLPGELNDVKTETIANAAKFHKELEDAIAMIKDEQSKILEGSDEAAQMEDYDVAGELASADALLEKHNEAMSTVRKGKCSNIDAAKKALATITAEVVKCTTTTASFGGVFKRFP